MQRAAHFEILANVIPTGGTANFDARRSLARLEPEVRTMSLRPLLVYAVIFALLPGSTGVCCLHDADSQDFEQSREPAVIELLVGSFLRHSREFYAWRVKDRLRRVQLEPQNVTYYDDLAVGYDRLGEYDKALEFLAKKQALAPDALATYANRTSILMHANRLPEAIAQALLALEIDPDAFDGRLRYQKYMMEYVLARTGDGRPLPLARVDADVAGRLSITGDFGSYLQRQYQIDLNEEKREEVYAAVESMLRFDNHESPVLLEMLGTLLADRESNLDQRHAARAFLKASYVAKSKEIRAAYREMAKATLARLQSEAPRGENELADVEKSFQEEIIAGRQWFKALTIKEVAWIRSGRDPEAGFRKFFQDPSLVLAAN